MGNFAYIALDREGRQTTGTIPADSSSSAFNTIIQKGLSPVSIKEQGAPQPSKMPRGSSVRVPQSSVETFTRELANLLSAGLSLARSLQLLRREASHPAARKTWSEIHDDVVGGTSLADALAKNPRVFSTIYVAMVRAGEAGGFLSLVLQQIADFRTRERDLKGKVAAAMVYPMVLATLACGVMVFLLTYFIPRFSSLFAEFGSNLPWLTRIIVAASEGIFRYGLIVLALVIAAVFAVRHLASSPAGKRFLEQAMLKVPLMGSVTLRFALVRFCRMLGTLLASGVPLVTALRVAKEAIGNQTMSDAVVRAIDEVQRGASLARSLASSPRFFPASVVEMITMAEETGRLDKELLRLSQTFETDLDRELRILVALAEPALLFFMAAIIGTIVVGMLLPIFTLQDLVH